MPNTYVPDDNEASTLLDAVDGEQDAGRKATMVDLLGRYRDSKAAAGLKPFQPDQAADRASKDRLEGMFGGLNQVEKHLDPAQSAAFSSAVEASTDRDEAKARMVNQSWVLSQYPQLGPAVDADWTGVKHQVAQKMFGNDSYDIPDTALYGQIGAHITKQKAERDMLADVLSNVQIEAAKGTGDWVAAWKKASTGISTNPAWNAANHDNYRDAAQKVFADAQENLKGLRPAISAGQEFYRLATNGPKPADPTAVGGAIGETPATEGQDHMEKVMAAREAFLSELMRLPVGQRQQALGFAVAGSADLAPKTMGESGTAGGLEKGAEALNRSIGEFPKKVGRFAWQALQSATELTQQARVGYYGESPTGAGGLYATQAEMQKTEMSAAIDAGLADAVDPIKSKSRLVQGIYGTIQMAPLIATSFMQPEAGIPLMMGALAEDNRRKFVEQGVPEAEAATLALAAAAPQTALMSLHANMVLGKTLPGFNQWLTKAVGTKLELATKMLATAGVETGFQNANMAIQEITPALYQQTAAALSKDVPDVDWHREMKEFAGGRADTFFTLLPMIMLGTGMATFKEASYGRQYLGNKTMLKAAGFTDAVAEEISQAATSGDVEKAQTLVQAGWDDPKQRPRAVIEKETAEAKNDLASVGKFNSEEQQRAFDELDAGMRESWEAQANPSGARAIKNEDDTWTVVDSKGVVVDKAATPESAVDLVHQVDRADSANLTNVVDDMIGYFKERGRGGPIEKTNDIRTLSDDVESGRLTEDKAKQLVDLYVGLGMLPEGTTPQEARIYGESARIYNAKEKVYEYVSRLHDGADPLVLVEEEAEGYFKQSVDQGLFSIDDVEKWRSAVEGKPFEPKATPSIRNREAVEWFSNYAKAYLTGKTQGDAPVPLTFRRWLDKMKRVFAEVFSLARDLIEKEKAGQLPEEFLTHLARAVGLDQAFLERRARDEERSEAGKPVAGQHSARDALHEIKLPTPKGENSGMHGELENLWTGLKFDQRMKLFTGTGGSLDSVAETLREDYGFTNILTGNDVVQLAESVFLHGKDVFSSHIPTGEESTMAVRKAAPEKTGDLFGQEDMPFNLEGEAGQDHAGAIEREESRRSAADKLKQDQGDLFKNTRAQPTDENAPKVVLPDGSTLMGPTTFAIRAYHGTPHKVDKFTTDRVGTGEGAQAYGWGLYFAQHPEVATEYKEKLSGKQSAGQYVWRGKEYDSTDFRNPVRHALALAFHQGKRVAISVAKEGLKDAQAGKPYALENGGVDYYTKMLEVAQDIASKREVAFNPGKLYTVELLPEHEEFMDWDRPISEQSDAVKAAVRKLDPNFLKAQELLAEGMKPKAVAEKLGMNVMDVAGGLGGMFYERIAGVSRDQAESKKASLALLEGGIPGIRYLDQGSRNGPSKGYIYGKDGYYWVDDGTGATHKRFPVGDSSESREKAKADSEAYFDELNRKRTYNYVLFDGKLAKIIEENGKPVAREEPEEKKEPTYSLKNQTESPEFKNWFGESKAVDPDGKPKVLYHGTDQDFSVPGGRPGSLSAKYGQGDLWFAENVKLAHPFVGGGRHGGGRVKEGSNIIPAFVSIKNPLDLSKTDVKASMSLSQFLELAGIPKAEHLAVLDEMEKVARPMREESFKDYPAEGDNWRPIKSTTSMGFPQTDEQILARHDTLYGFADSEAIIQVLKARGYDGIKAREGVKYNEQAATGAARVYSRNDEIVESTTWMPFTAKQIKSATGNRGTFDAESPDITFNLAPAPDTPAFKNWFKKSAVVDEHGEPLVVHHGTKAPSETNFAFDYSKMVGRNEGAGFYFTDNPDVARGYGQDGTVISAYLSLQKPMPYDQPALKRPTLKKLVTRVAEIEAKVQGADIEDGFLANYADARSDGLNVAIAKAVDGLAPEATALDQISGIVGSGVPAEIVNRAVTEVTGFDGIIADGFSNLGAGSHGVKQTIYVAFFPEQVKSVKNSGAFDPSNPDVTASVGPMNRADDVREAMRPRMIGVRVKASEMFADEMKRQVGDMRYAMRSMDTNEREAKRIIEEHNGDLSKLTRVLADPTLNMHPATKVALAFFMAESANKVGDYGAAAEIAKQAAMDATSAGQSINELKRWSVFTQPETCQQLLQGEIEKENNRRKDREPAIQAVVDTYAQVQKEARKLLRSWLDEINGIADKDPAELQPVDVSSLPDVTFSLSAQAKSSGIVQVVAKLLKNSGAEATEKALIERYGEGVEKHLPDIFIEAQRSLIRKEAKGEKKFKTRIPQLSDEHIERTLGSTRGKQEEQITIPTVEELKAKGMSDEEIDRTIAEARGKQESQADLIPPDDKTGRLTPEQIEASMSEQRAMGGGKQSLADMPDLYDRLVEHLMAKIKAKGEADNITVPRGIRDQISEVLNRHGLKATPDDVKRIIGARQLLENMTPAQAEELANFAKRIASTPLGSFERGQQTMELFSYVHDQLAPHDLLDVAFGLWYANVLSSLLTSARNVAGNASMLFLDQATETIFRKPTAYWPYLQQLGKAAGFGLEASAAQGKNTFKTGQEGLQKSLSLGDERRQGVLESKTAPLKTLREVSRVATRFLSVQDLFFANTAYEMKARQLAWDQARRESAGGKIKPEEINEHVDRLLNEATDQVQTFADRARVEWENLTDEIREGYDQANWEKRRVKELQMFERDKQLVSRALDFAQKVTLDFEPEGLMGLMMSGLSRIFSMGEKAAEQVKSEPARWLTRAAAKYGRTRVIPFMRVPVNVFNRALDYGPVGYGRALMDAAGVPVLLSSGKTRIRSAEERSDLLKRATVGTMALMPLALLCRPASPDDDPEKSPWLQIHGAGSGNPQTNIALNGPKYRAYSLELRVGDKQTFIDYRMFPLAPYLAAIGSLHDRTRYKKDMAEKSALVQGWIIAQAMKESFLSSSPITSLRELSEAAAENQPMSERAVNRTLARGTVGVVSNLIPLSGLWRSLDQLAGGDRNTRDTLLAASMAEIPIAGRLNLPSVDVLGDPMTNRGGIGWLADWSKMSTPESRIYQAFAQKDVTPTDISRYQHKLTPEEYYEFAKLRGQLLKDALLSKNEDGQTGLEHFLTLSDKAREKDQDSAAKKYLDRMSRSATRRALAQTGFKVPAEVTPP